METYYKDVVKTNEVCLANLIYTIDINKLFDKQYIETDELRLEITSNFKNTMNCLSGRIIDKINNTQIALKIYPAKVRYNISNSKDVEYKYEEIKTIFKQNNIIFYSDLYKKKITINILLAPTMQDYNSALYATTQLLTKKDKFDKELCKIHGTGFKYPNIWENTIKNFIYILINQNLTHTSNKIEDFYYIMSNCIYKVGFNISLWDLVSNINKISDFEDCFVIYDNLRDSHEAIITLPLRTLNVKSKLWRNNIEASFIVRTTGSITQSCPSDEMGQIAYYMFKKMIETLGDKIKSNINT